MFIYPASSWTEGIISSYAPLLAGRLKGNLSNFEKLIKKRKI